MHAHDLMMASGNGLVDYVCRWKRSTCRCWL